MSSDRINNEELKRIAEKEERRFLSLLLKDKDCLSDAVESGIKPGKQGHFWLPEHRYLYNYIYKYFKEHSAKMTRSAMESLLATHPNIGDEDCSAGMSLWDKIWSNNEASKEDYSMLKKSLDCRYRQWKIADIMQDNIADLIKATGNQNELVEDIQSEIASIDGVQENKYSLVMGVEEGMDKAMNHITQMRDDPEVHRGIMCGIRGIDDLYHGFVRGSYTIITGMVNGGKTTLMFNMAWNMAKAGYRVIYVSIEKEAVSMYERLLALHALIDYNRIKVGGTGTAGLTDYYYQKLETAKKDVVKMMKENENFTIFQETQGVRLSRILNESNKIHDKKPIDVLVVDYLGVIGLEERYQGRNDLEAAAVSSKLQSWGKSNKVAVITGMQFNNTATKEIRKKVSKMSGDGDDSEISMNTEDMGTSQKIVADCENNIGVALNDDDPPTKMVVHVIKARDNQAHRTVLLDFDGRLGRISDPELSPGQVQAVDDLIYNEEITEDQLMSDDGLFAEEPNGDEDGSGFGDYLEKEEEPNQESEKSTDEELDSILDTEESSISDADADFLDSLESKPEPKPEPEPVKKQKGLARTEVEVDQETIENGDINDILGLDDL